MSVERASVELYFHKERFVQTNARQNTSTHGWFVFVARPTRDARRRRLCCFREVRRDAREA